MIPRTFLQSAKSRYLATAFLIFSTTAVELPAAEPLFSLNFENGFAAEAQGRSEAMNHSNQPSVSPGIAGAGAEFIEGSALVYEAAGNLDKTEGTIALWVKLNPVAQAKTSQVRTLFAEEASDEVGNGRLKIELHSGRFIRVSIKDRRDSYVYFRHLAEWAPEEWHHVAVVWNVNKGATLYIDAQPVSISWMPPWEPRSHQRFVVGAANAEGAESALAVIDDLVVFGRELTEADLREAYEARRRFTAEIAVLDPFVPAGQADELKVAFENPGNRAIELNELRYELIDNEGKTVQRGKLPKQRLDGLATSSLDLRLKALPAGPYTGRLSYLERGEQRAFSFELLAMESRETPKPREAKMTRLTVVDATTQEPVAETGGTQVIESPAGVYREAGDTFHDRFAMDFTIADVDQPHVAIIRYPDDKPRTMEIMLQDFGNVVDFQAHTGVFTGEEYPVSNDMLERRLVFWPRSKRQAFIFMTAEDGFPAAVSSIEVFRLKQFEVTSRRGEFEGSVPARQAGIYYEDPVLFHSFGTGRDLDGFVEATDRLVEYMRSFGQTAFEYPLAWYAGPLYGTSEQPLQPDIEGAQGGARPHPPGFPLYLLKRLGENGMKFTAGLQLHTLPSLNQYAHTDWNRIGKGEDTIINVKNDGTLWHGYWHGSDPNYNAADPRVMEATNRIVDEVALRYGREPAFDGISIVITRPKLFSFGSLASGYNDNNLQRFQRDSGIAIPGYSLEDSDRFSKSYEWLMNQPDAKEAWIDWRCRVLFEHYAAMAKRLASVRSDLKLNLTVFVHYTNNERLAEYLSEPSGQAMREMGIDPRLYQDQPNIRFNYTVIPADLRWGRGRLDLENDLVSRTVFTAPEVVANMRATEAPGMIIHDRYFEDAIGKEQPLAGLTELGAQEMVWRASTLNPARFHSLETYAHALDNMDVSLVLKGGYVLGTLGIEDELARFARSFQALPAVSFDDVPAAVDPARVRQKVVDGQLYFYVLNMLPEPIEVSLKLAKRSDISEPTTGETTQDADILSIRLEPYGLRTFKSLDASQRVDAAEVQISASWLAELKGQMSDLLAAAEDNADAAKRRGPYLNLLQEMWDAGRYARVYSMLQEHWTREVAN